MPEGADRLEVRLRVARFSGSPEERRLLLPLSVGSIDRTLILLLVPDVNTPQSLITPSAMAELRTKGLVAEAAGPTAWLRDVWIEGQPVPDVLVHLSPKHIRITSADGILGWDFLQKFDMIHYHDDSGVLILVP